MRNIKQYTRGRFDIPAIVVVHSEAENRHMRFFREDSLDD